MANAAKEIKVSLKLLANVTDAKKLTEYIHTLGQELKKSAGPEADALRQKLLAIKKAVYQGDRSAGAVKASAQNVAALMPDISKSKALGSLGALDAKLAEYGTAQANVIRKTVADMNAALNSGSLSSETVDALSASLGSFVEQANKLPPEGLKKLGGEIRKVVSDTEDLNGVIAEINSLQVTTDVTGENAKETLRKRLDITDAALEVNAQIKSILDNIDDLGKEGGDRFDSIRKKAESLLNSNLGKKSVEDIDSIIAELSQLGLTFDGKLLTKAGPAISELIKKFENLEVQVRDTDNAFGEVANAGTFLDAINLQVDNLSKNIVKTLSAIPGRVGKAFKAIGGTLTVLFTVLIAGVKKLISTFDEIRNFKEDFTFDHAQKSLAGCVNETQRLLRLFEQQHEHEKSIRDIMREQEDATRNLTRAQMELNKQKELAAVRTDEERSAIEDRYSKMEIGLDAGDKQIGRQRRVEDIDSEIEKLKNAIEANMEEVDLYRTSQENARKMQRQSQTKATSGWNQFWKGAEGATFGLLNTMFGAGNDADRYQEQAKKWGEAANQNQEAMNKAIEELEAKKKKLVELNTKRDLLAGGQGDGGVAGTVTTQESLDQQISEMEKKAREEAQRKREEEAQRRRDRIKHAREREDELFAREEGDSLRSAMRTASEPWQNVNQQLDTALSEYDRYTKRMEDAKEKRDKILRDYAASERGRKGLGMTQEEETALSEATSDYTSARSNMYQEKSTIESLRKQIHDRRVDEADTQYQYGKEDRDFARAGRYSRANWSQRLRMDVERYREGQRQFSEAQAQIDADNAGTRTLSPEQRRIVERNRNEGREKMTSMRENIRSAAMEGDTQKASFLSSLFGHRNRLTAMGLGGDVANWDKQTASNTRKMVQQNEQVIRALNQRGGGFGWGM